MYEFNSLRFTLYAYGWFSWAYTNIQILNWLNAECMKMPSTIIIGNAFIQFLENWIICCDMKIEWAQWMYKIKNKTTYCCLSTGMQLSANSEVNDKLRSKFEQIKCISNFEPCKCINQRLEVRFETIANENYVNNSAR